MVYLWAQESSIHLLWISSYRWPITHGLWNPRSIFSIIPKPDPNYQTWTWLLNPSTLLCTHDFLPWKVCCPLLQLMQHNFKGHLGYRSNTCSVLRHASSSCFSRWVRDNAITDICPQGNRARRKQPLWNGKWWRWNVEETKVSLNYNLRDFNKIKLT